MDWYRIKTILIILFVAINIFLAVLLLRENMATRRMEEEHIAAANAVLAKNGITIKAEIPRVRGRMATLTVENPLAEKEAFAEMLLGGKPVSADNTYYRNGNSVEITEAGFHFVGKTKPKMPGKNAVRTVKDMLTRMGFSMDYAEGRQEGQAVYFSAAYEGKPIYGCNLVVIPGEDGQAEMQGTWHFVQEVKNEKNKIISAADALMSFLQEKTAAQDVITCVDYGYGILVEGGYRTADAVPVWHITSDEMTKFYDARK